MAVNINQLSRLGTVSGGVLLPCYSSDQGDTRSVSVTDLTEYVAASDDVATVIDDAIVAANAVGPIYVADYGTLDPTGATDNTAIFQSAYIAANAANRTLQLPAGTFLTTGLTWNEDGPEVIGWGPFNTIFKPVANSQAHVIRLQRSPTDSRRQKRRFGGFSIDLTGKTGCRALQTWWLVGSDVRNISINCGEAAPYTGGNIGWHSEADQYSSFSDIAIERGSYLFRMRPDTAGAAGGGINNNYTNMLFSECIVGMDIANDFGFPMGNLEFINCKVQNYTGCSLFTYNVQGVRINGLTPENATEAAPAATIVVDGHTIQTGMLHCDYRSQIHFEGFDHVSNETYRVDRATNRSHLTFRTAKGARVVTEADATSTIHWSGQVGNGSILKNTTLDLAPPAAARSVYGWHPANTILDPSFMNEVPTPYKGGTLTARAGATCTVNTDANLGPVMTAVFGAAAGVYQTSNSLYLEFGGSTSMPANAEMFHSILVKSSVAGEYSFYHFSTIQDNRVTLVADQWTRVFLSNWQGGAATYSALEVFPTFATGATLQLMKPALLINPDAQTYREFSRAHVYNPKDAKGHVLRGTVAPATGTHVVGAEAWHSAPAAATTPGWVCVTAGTPGTWKAMAVLAA